MNGPVEELSVQPVDDAQDAGGGHGEPSAHDEPGAPEAGVLVDAHGVKHQADPVLGSIVESSEYTKPIGKIMSVMRMKPKNVAGPQYDMKMPSQ